ncbi:MAG: D-alanyl-D-alanine carboxypeptidase/D-alanyl-D-alanine-endopeptidase [Phycisphaerales bacterium]|nr:D-alanyl-D-alanine carboxypeptidase/D-alanyl-D-alanine-endopeptidase [Phycisphaerales bacterium]
MMTPLIRARMALAAASAALALATGMRCAHADLGAEISRAVSATGLKKARIAVSVRRMDGAGDTAARSLPSVSILAGEPLVPASNMKLVTTGAALLTLGADFSFRTRLVLDGDRLVIVGDGDPAFADPALLAESTMTLPNGTVKQGITVEDLVGAWVRAVSAAGIASVREVIADDRIFAREGHHPVWPKDQLGESYCTPPSGINFHVNALRIWPQHVAGGAPDLSRMEPAIPGLDIRNRASSRNRKNDRNSIWFAVSPVDGSLTAHGNVRQSYVEPVEVALVDPASSLALLLAERLKAAGVAVGGARAAVAGDPAPSGRTVGPVIESPLATVITRCNVDSQNMYAEALLKRIAHARTGQAGTWTDGARAIHETLARVIGMQPAATFAVSDGSGLSRANRVTADGMTRWLVALAGEPGAGPVFADSLAVNGRTGTVRKRMNDIDPAHAVVQCKTGYIDGTSCLSGYVTAPDGRRYAFSVLANGLTEPAAVSKAKQLQDRIARLLADELKRDAPRAAMGG